MISTIKLVEKYEMANWSLRQGDEEVNKSQTPPNREYMYARGLALCELILWLGSSFSWSNTQLNTFNSTSSATISRSSRILWNKESLCSISAETAFICCDVRHWSSNSPRRNLLQGSLLKTFNLFWGLDVSCFLHNKHIRPSPST